METFEYSMPTKILFGENVIINNSSLFKNYGKKALIITGKHSAKKNGALQDIIDALNKHKIEYCIFDEIEENPSMETVQKGGEFGRDEKVDLLLP